MEEELIRNVDEFLESGRDNLAKRRYNAAISDFFKAIVISCDVLIYRETKIVPKSHNDRFSLLKKYFLNLYISVSELFKIYIKSYNLRLERNDAVKLEKFANEIREKLNKK